jgi:hypothetical protein
LSILTDFTGTDLGAKRRRRTDGLNVLVTGLV